MLLKKRSIPILTKDIKKVIPELNEIRIIDEICTYYEIISYSYNYIIIESNKYIRIKEKNSSEYIKIAKPDDYLIINYLLIIRTNGRIFYYLINSDNKMIMHKLYVQCLTPPNIIYLKNKNNSYYLNKQKCYCFEVFFHNDFICLQLTNTHIIKHHIEDYTKIDNSIREFFINNKLEINTELQPIYLGLTPELRELEFLNSIYFPDKDSELEEKNKNISLLNEMVHEVYDTLFSTQDILTKKIDEYDDLLLKYNNLMKGTIELYIKYRYLKECNNRNVATIEKINLKRSGSILEPPAKIAKIN